MPRAHLDHLVLTAPSLEAGVDHVRQALGVIPQAGGEHPRMGTHNALLKLGEGLNLEVIAINPNAPPPEQPRWFRLDEPDPARPIRLATWVARTDDIRAATATSPISLGAVEPMSRGQLDWLITIPADGDLPLQGIVPTLIQWTAGAHPSSALPENGCTLERLEGFHPEAEQVLGVLQAIGYEGDFRVSAPPPGRDPYLIAHIRTPSGVRLLGDPDLALNSDAGH